MELIFDSASEIIVIVNNPCTPKLQKSETLNTRVVSTHVATCTSANSKVGPSSFIKTTPNHPTTTTITATTTTATSSTTATMSGPAITIVRSTTLPHPLPTVSSSLLSPTTVETLTLLPSIAHTFSHGATTRTYVATTTASNPSALLDLSTPVYLTPTASLPANATTVTFTFWETVMGGLAKPFLEASWTFLDEDNTVGLYESEVKAQGVKVRKTRVLKEEGEGTEVTETCWIWTRWGTAFVARYFATGGMEELVNGFKGVVDVGAKGGARL